MNNLHADDFDQTVEQMNTGSTGEIAIEQYIAFNRFDTVSSCNGPRRPVETKTILIQTIQSKIGQTTYLELDQQQETNKTRLILALHLATRIRWTQLTSTGRLRLTM